MNTSGRDESNGAAKFGLARLNLRETASLLVNQVDISA